MKASTCIENIHRSVPPSPSSRHVEALHRHTHSHTHSRWCRWCICTLYTIHLYSIPYIYVGYNVRDVRWINDSSSGHLKWFAFCERTIWLSNDRLRCENILLVGPKWHNSKVISTRMTAAFLLVMCVFYLPRFSSFRFTWTVRWTDVLCASHTWFYISRWICVCVCVCSSQVYGLLNIFIK